MPVKASLGRLEGLHRLPGAILALAISAGLTFSVPSLAHPQHARPEIRVEGAWMRAMPPVQSTTAAYFTLYNASPETIVLTGARTDAAMRVEMHEHRHEGGVMQMREVARVELPPGDRVEFAPGAYHLMVMGLHRPLAPGDWATFSLEFADGSRAEVRFPVQKSAHE